MRSEPETVPSEAKTGPVVRDMAPLEGFTLFHEDWWLDIVSDGRIQRLTVFENERLVGVLPVLITASAGLKWCRMPPLTHVLGPAVAVGEGSDNARMHRRFKITSELLEKVPRVSDFKQVLDCSVPEAIAFQCAGFRTTPHYTIRVDCADMDAVWKAMRQKTRRFIRRSQEKYEAVEYSDVDMFVAFYTRNLQARNRILKGEFTHFGALYAACQQRDCGAMFAIEDADKALVAAIFVVWGHGVMYYLLTTRDPACPDYGVVSVLILRAMQEAHRRSLVFDLDGIASQAIFHFLSGFGGEVAVRTVVQRRAPWLNLGKAAQHLVRGQPESTFY